MPHDPLLLRLKSAFAEVPGVEAVVLGGSRARGSGHAASDYDIGLYFKAATPLNTERLLAAAQAIADDPAATTLTPVGEWGPWIVGGAWLSVEEHKVDLLYRDIEAVEAVMESCRAGIVTMDYQAGHPHGFCSAIWMGEIAYCRPLHDPRESIARLKSIAMTYPPALRDALIRRFQWEVLFGIENAELAIARYEQTHVAGCLYRSLACIAQVLFALNERYLINEKGALPDAALLPLTIPRLTEDTKEIWRLIGHGAFAPACDVLRDLDLKLKALTQSNGPRP
ncbi:nucleotidyltransferase domain-containing protein [Bradyrhizobium sp.]|uniref:nucleotidyltransferase domain-containing protein n=1 Tax=Bradyrhizobium sp. TaxID=376 RepID=UPI0039E2E9D7